MKNEKKIIKDIKTEIARQDGKWGENRSNHSFLWNIVLAEEVGEVAKGILDKDMPNVREELIQVAAICAQMISAIDRDDFKR